MAASKNGNSPRAIKVSKSSELKDDKLSVNLRWGKLGRNGLRSL